MSRHSFSFKRSAIPRTNIEALERRLLLAADTAPYVTTGQIEFTDLILGNAVSNHGLLAADLDGDGDLDAVATSNIDHDVYVYENLNDGTFTRHVIEDDLRGAYPALLDDLDEDGDVDILVVGFNRDDLVYFENNGNLVFNKQLIDAEASGGHSIVAVDIDEDGNKDLVVSMQLGGSIDWYKNDGNENFSRFTIDNDSPGAKRADAADFDGDGDIDIVSNSFDNDQVAVHFNDGTQAFAKSVIDSSADGAYFVYAVDIDLDGDADIVSATKDDNSISIYRNDGSGSFSKQVLTTNAIAARSVWADDLDRDGDIDVVSGSVDDDKVAWFENDGMGGFTERLVSTIDGAYGVSTIDFDKDGDIDVLSGGRDSGTVQVHFNQVVHRAEVASGATFQFSSAFLETIDSDDGPSEIVYTVVSPPTQGTLRRSSVPLAANSTFTQADINNGLIDYLHNGVGTATESFVLTVEDGGEDGFPPIELPFELTLSQPAAVPQTDEFNTGSLGTNVWTFVNPKNDGSVSSTGTNLQITAPAGTQHDIWTNPDAPRIMQTIDNVDFDVVAKFDALPVGAYALTGFFVEADADTFLRFDVYSTNNANRFFSRTFDGPNDVTRLNANAGFASAPFYLRLQRVGDQWTAYSSTDGTNWDVETSFNFSMNVTGIGITSGNAGGSPPEFTTSIDYFRVNGAAPPANAPPVAQDDNVTTTQDTQLDGDVFADNGNGTDSDPDGDSFSVTQLNGNAALVGVPTATTNGTVTLLADGTFSYTPNSGFDGSDSFGYTIQDTSGNSDSATVTITITPTGTNTPPVAVDDSVTTTVDTPVVFNVIDGTQSSGNPDSDSDGNIDPTTVQVISPVASGTLVNNLDGTFQFTPAPGATGTVSFTYNVQDNLGATSNNATVNIDVTAPATGIVSDEFNTGSLDTGVWTFVNPKNDGSVSSTGTNLQITAPAGTQHDIWTNPDAPRIMQTIDNVDFDVVAKFDALPVGAYALTGFFVEADADTFLRFDVYSTNNANRFFSRTFDGPNDVTRLNANAGFASAPFYLRLQRVGDQWTAYSSTDGTNWDVETSFNFSMNVTGIGITSGNAGGSPPEFTTSIDYFRVNGAAPPANAPPVAQDDNVTTTQDTQLDGDVFADNGNGTDSDPDGDSFSVTQLNGNAALVGVPTATTNGTVTLLADGTFSYTPNSGFDGSDSFGYTIQDTSGNSDSATVTITITPTGTNTPPVAVDDSVTTTVDTPVVFNVIDGTQSSGNPDSDSDGNIDPTTVQVISPVASGTLVNNLDGTFQFTPAPGASGNVSFTYNVQDNLGATSNNATVNIDVTAPATGIVSDEFNTGSLDTGVWTFVNPKNDGSVSSTGTNLQITAPAGTQHDIWTNPDAPRIMQTIDNVDFDVVAKFDALPVGAYVLTGFFVEADADTFLRFDVYSTNNANRFFSRTFDGPNDVTRLNANAGFASAPFYLRLQRVGDQWTAYSSTDGTNWDVETSFNFSMNVTGIGITSGNAGGSPPEFTTSIDYFRVNNAAAPAGEPESQPAVDSFADFLAISASFGPSSNGRELGDMNDDGAVDDDDFDLLAQNIIDAQSPPRQTP